MIKKLTLAIAAILFSCAMFAQTPTGGVKGTVVNRADRSAIAGAALVLYNGAEQIATATSASDGTFLISGLADGMYNLVITADEYLQNTINVTVNDGYVKNMFNLSMTPSKVVLEIDDSNFADFDMDDSGYSDSPVILYGQNDVFNNIAGYNFSDIRFRARGYTSEAQDVYLAGIKMNDAITGYSPYSLWSGLNEATRTKDSVTGAEISDYGFGGVNGLTNIAANASSMRTGWRGSVLTNSALYRLRLMLSYASGKLDNGWAYALSFSTRLGGNDWIQGQYYRSFGYYGSVEKSFGDTHRIGLIFMAAPGQRGTQNASTQEVYDLMGDNMYNSNWGYQNGKVRNSRVKSSHEPIAVLKYDFTPSQKFQATATLLYRFGWNGSTAIDFYNAADPRPDYYRNLPSYFYMENSDYGRNNLDKALWAQDSWTQNIGGIAHMNWDAMYAANMQNSSILYGQRRNRSVYVQEQRRVDQKDLNAAFTFKWKPINALNFAGGVSGKINRTENYKIAKDLLGGDYYLNTDSFAEREYHTAAYIQNNLDYFMAHNGNAQIIHEGDKYGYDYYAQIRKAEAFLNGTYTAGGFKATVSGKVGYTSFWRDGLYRKGLFAGLDENGSEISYDGTNLTSYDPITGDVITSKGKSAVSNFLTGGVKLNLEYVINGGHRFYANGGIISEAPTFSQAFISPRTRNSLTPDLKPYKTYSGDVNYQFSTTGYEFRITGYWTKIMDQSDVMSFYDDSQNSFTNFAMSGINQRHAGVELGFKVPTPINNLSLQGVLSWGDFIYTSNPKMYQTVDNNASVVKDTYGITIPYWKSHPVFEKDADGAFVTDADGKYIVDYNQKHYVAGTPQIAASLGLSYNYNYWFIDFDADYFTKSYLDMNPLYRTDMATAGPDKTVTPVEVEYMAAQEKFDPAFLLNCSIGKSWYIQRKYQIGFSLNVNNLLNNRNVKTGGYEQTRLIDSSSKERYYRFDSKYFYMAGTNYMLNVYFRF